MAKGKKTNENPEIPLVDDLVHEKPLVDDEPQDLAPEPQVDGGAVIKKKVTLEKVLVLLKKGDLQKATAAVEEILHNRKERLSAREPSQFNLFVKEKMAELKASDPTLSTKDRMAFCAKMWKDQKGN